MPTVEQLLGVFVERDRAIEELQTRIVELECRLAELEEVLPRFSNTRPET